LYGNVWGSLFPFGRRCETGNLGGVLYSIMASSVLLARGMFGRSVPPS
jgi:hypothetical protein